jgi:hypothetical protein
MPQASKSVVLRVATAAALARAMAAIWQSNWLIGRPAARRSAAMAAQALAAALSNGRLRRLRHGLTHRQRQIKPVSWRYTRTDGGGEVAWR